VRGSFFSQHIVIRFTCQQESESDIIGNALDIKRRQLLEDEERFLHERKKALLGQILKQPWRQEREAVSAAFSKWVRVTMFDAAEQEENEMIQALEQQNHESMHVIDQLEERCAELVAQTECFEASQRENENQIASQKEVVSQLRSEVANLLDENEILKKEIESFKEQHEKQKSGVPSSPGSAQLYRQVEDRMKRMESLVAQREMEMERKERDVQSRERAVQVREQEAAVRFDDANVRVRKMADQLRQRELEIEFKETHLASELARCGTSQQRVAKMAQALKEKAERLAKDRFDTDRRMNDCDALETQLSKWQKQQELSLSSSNPQSSTSDDDEE